MRQPTLYLLVGYPGSGKTTTSRTIHELTGAAHIWADHERQVMFGQPTHSPTESEQLYTTLNTRTADILSRGEDVVFDTNFSFLSDRNKLRQITTQAGAQIKLLWVRVAPELARERATADHHAEGNGYDNTMTPETFDRIVSHLEPPTDDEQPILLDGTLITPEYITAKLDLALRVDTGTPTSDEVATA